MRFKSAILAQASGSVGGATYSHNAGGMYIRNRSIPTDPASAAQVVIRSLVSQLVNLWTDTLTAAQRDTWNAYAAAVPLIDVFGDPRNRSGINHYVRSNVPRLQAGLPRVDSGPSIHNLGPYTQPSFAIDSATQMFAVTFTATDDWASEDDAALLLWGSRPNNPGVNFFKGPYTAMPAIEGDSVTPPTSPVDVAAPHVYSLGQKGFLRVNVTRADGRLSTPFSVGEIAT